MYSNSILTAAAAALTTSTLVFAQTHTDCNPLDKVCPDDPALSGTYVTDFTKGPDDTLFKEFDGTVLTYGPDGAKFTITDENTAPTIGSTKYIMGGKVDVVLAIAPGAGVVTSLVLQSDDLDEIDLEWLGGKPNEVQTNYFSKGDTTTYVRGATHGVENALEFHKYTIDWKPDSVMVFYVDDTEIRRVSYAEAKGGSEFPQTPMQIRLGTWVAGKKGAPQGTVDWAGGYADFSQAPFVATYKSVTVTDYSLGETGVVSYSYSDTSGTWQSIVANKDNSKGRDEESDDKGDSKSGNGSTDGGSKDGDSKSGSGDDGKGKGPSTTTTVPTKMPTVTLPPISAAPPTSKPTGNANNGTVDDPPYSAASGIAVSFVGLVMTGAGLLFSNIVL